MGVSLSISNINIVVQNGLQAALLHILIHPGERAGVVDLKLFITDIFRGRIGSKTVSRAICFPGAVVCGR